MSAPPLVLERDGRVPHLVLDAPPGNAMGREFFRCLADLLPELEGLEAPGLVVRGRGRHFSSGADLDELLAMVREGDGSDAGELLLRATNLFERLARLPYPTVAAIGGCCLGSGLELALACRRRVAADNAVLSLPETGFGLIPGCGGTVRLPRLVGEGRALELILSGRTFDAREARELGVADEIAPRAELLEAAERRALRLARG